jgi:HSP20 family protein
VAHCRASPVPAARTPQRIRGQKKERRRWVERSYGSFTRSLTLPGDALADRVDASFTDGVLTVTIPKSEAAKPRTVAIK